MSKTNEIQNLKKQIVDLKLEIKQEIENRIHYSLKGDIASLNQSFEKEGRLKTKIQDIEYKIYKLEEPDIKKQLSKLESQRKKEINSVHDKKSPKNKKVNNNTTKKKTIGQDVNKSSKKNKKESNTQKNLLKNYLKSINRTNVKEDYAIILDYLPQGYMDISKSKFAGHPIAQAIGINHYTFLELTPKRGKYLEIGDIVYIGNGKRDKIYTIGRLDLNNLTKMSKLEVDDVIFAIVDADEERYVKFFNVAGSISLQRHALNLLPNVTRPMAMKIIKQRDIKPFESYYDIVKRVPSIKDPREKIVFRIQEELGLVESKSKRKLYIFTQKTEDRRIKKRKRK